MIRETEKSDQLLDIIFGAFEPQGGVVSYLILTLFAIVVTGMASLLWSNASQFSSMIRHTRKRTSLVGTWHCYRRSRRRSVDKPGQDQVIQLYERWEIRRDWLFRNFAIQTFDDQGEAEYRGKIDFAKRGYFFFKIKSVDRAETVQVVMRIPDAYADHFVAISSSTNYNGNPHSTALFFCKEELSIEDGIKRLDKMMLPPERSMITAII